MLHPTPPADHLPSGLTTTEFDVIVLGAGAVGENVVTAPLAAGLSVAVVEDELVGGECSYWACMPSKGLLRPLQVLEQATHIGGALGGGVGGLHAAAVLARRDRFNSGFDDTGQVGWLDGAGATLVRGRGVLRGVRTVAVTGADGSSATLTARRAVVVCTGSLPAVPGALEAVDPWTNREGTASGEVPATLVVVGGGPVGCELAQAWQSLGSKVTLVHSGAQLLAGQEPEVGRRLAASMAALGVEVLADRKVVASRADGGAKVVVLDDGTELRADQVLVGVGRVPATAGIGLDTVGLTDGAAIEVDDTTTVRGVEGGWLHACGDCTTSARLTHMGKYQARVCGDVIVARAAGTAPGDPPAWSRLTATAEHGAVPAVVFTVPEVASVGRTEAAARAAGLAVRCVEYEIGRVAGAALLADGYDGWAKLVIDTDRDVVVGATFVGPEVAELLHAATIAVVGEVTLERLWHAVPSYPTVSEIWLRLLETARG